jgi:hypothetical protein
VGYARTAAGVTSLLNAGDYTSVEVVAGLKFLQDNRASAIKQTNWYHYAMYYAAQAMYQSPEPGDWQQWYPAARDALLAAQQPDGRWDSETGPVYGTAMSVLALSVPYRYLPVYQH